MLDGDLWMFRRVQAAQVVVRFERFRVDFQNAAKRFFGQSMLSLSGQRQAEIDVALGVIGSAPARTSLEKAKGDEEVVVRQAVGKALKGGAG